MPGLFRLVSDFEPRGDQPGAIRRLEAGLREGRKHQVLLGVTGSGKTFTMAKVIEAVERPTLVLSHNKTLAAQLFQEFRRFFPDNAVEYFVSYYDYYQPEAYIPQSDTYIEKESTINDEIDRLRHSATRSLFERRDVIIVASVSCIYGLGSPEAYHGMMVLLEPGMTLDRDAMLRKLVEIQYERTPFDIERGKFRVRGDVIEIFPSYEEFAVRVEMFGDDIETVSAIDPVRGAVIKKLDRIPIYPNSHYVTPRDRLLKAIDAIRAELKDRLAVLESEKKLLEAQRLHQRTMFDLEMIKEIGYCQGIENYSRHLTGRKPGEAPPTLMDYLPKDHLIVVDESHVSIPQVRGMYFGDRARKLNLVEYGFRLPSAVDNRPLQFEEFEERAGQRIYVSATPGPYELQQTGGEFVEQVIRPTGLIDPEIEVRPVRHQVDDLLHEVRQVIERGERVLITTLTKRMAEELSRYYMDLGLKVQYLHSDIETLQRVQILRGLRRGDYDVLVGVNLLREGLDLPEVSLVGILDADKEGYLRSAGSLIQTVGRAARNVRGRVLMYADVMTDSMKACIGETDRRRARQRAYNEEHGITPESIVKAIDEVLGSVYEADYLKVPIEAEEGAEKGKSPAEIESEVAALTKQMHAAAAALRFEEAAALRDRIKYLQKVLVLATA
ncbi:MAG TPA: excinuclease ABC subunit UvrB [Candidatus Polarisedimenticolia bacterium]|jgi:excinuclease ABC subunit B|nr:excinuclease ABC subunit UvrB [Candidatus Polarisedimenticolia bacterium]